jgi:adenosylcobinamide-phosphate synthase
MAERIMNEVMEALSEGLSAIRWNDGSDWFGVLPPAAGWVTAAALLLDAVLGDPVRPTHPVILMGKLVALLERLLYRPSAGKWPARLAGACLVAAVLGIVGLVSWSVLWLSGQVSGWLALAVSVWGVYTAVAPRELARAAEAVRRPLAQAPQADIRRARRQVGKIVGRDTERLDEREIVRATVETVAENTVDALISPVVYGLLFGMPGALLYRAVNTLDSMVGYKNEKYLHFGWAAARLDDAANWLPARLTGWLLLVVGFCRRLDVKGGFTAWRRDASSHPSPNSGIPEAVVAGLLGVRLGGVNWYQGKPSARSFLGQERRQLETSDIALVCRLLGDLTGLMVMAALFWGLFCRWSGW